MTFTVCACPLCASAAGTSTQLPPAPPSPTIGTPITGDYRIDTLIEGLSFRWNAGKPVGTPVEVSYSFMTTKPTYGGTDSGGDTGFQPFSEEQKAAARSIFAQLSTELNISFKEVEDTATSYGQIRFGNNNQQSSSGYAFVPNTDSTDLGGDVWISMTYSGDQTPGSFSYATLVHEIGHALGLKHPGNYNAGESSTPDPKGNFLGEVEDNTAYTIMSYRDPAKSEGQQRTWFGTYDMLALHYLYGVKDVHTGAADTYSYNDASGRTLTMIEDSAGKSDTIDLSAVTLGAKVDLREGAFSSIGAAASGNPAVNNVSIMYGTVIENVIATAGNDVIIGNAADNRITSNGGSDTINGGAGIDTVVLSGNRKAWVLSTASQVSVQKIGGSDTDMLTNVERVQFADMTVNLTTASNAKTVSANDLKSIEELYIAYFNRTPDADGLSYWVDQLKAGQSIGQIGESFYSAAVQYANLTGYTSTMTNADFVRVVYKNVLGRSGATAPPDEDVNFWAGNLANGTATRGSLIATMLNSAHSFKGDAKWGWVADLLDNKVNVANYFAVDNGLNYNTPEDSISKGMAIASAITATDTQSAIQLIGIQTA